MVSHCSIDVPSCWIYQENAMAVLLIVSCDLGILINSVEFNHTL